MQIGDIVISRAGHDTGKPFVVTAQVGENFVLIADGTTRRVENPKLKKCRHLVVAGQSDVKTPTNAEIKKRLKKFVSERRMYAEK